MMPIVLRLTFLPWRDVTDWLLERIPEEDEPKKKRRKEASESDSNTWPLDESEYGEETDSDLDSTTRSKAKPKDLEDSYERSV
ncbi:hypothetical protein Tco_0243044 [Tanacetum coccineum]